MKFSRELGVSAIPPAENEANTTYARRTVKAKAKHQSRQQLRSKWESKALHGKYPLRVRQADVDQDKTHRWLKAAGLKAETEGFIIAVQDQSLPMNPKCIEEQEGQKPHSRRHDYTPQHQHFSQSHGKA